MTVKEMIKVLEKYPQDMNVVGTFSGEDGRGMFWGVSENVEVKMEEDFEFVNMNEDTDEPYTPEVLGDRVVIEMFGNITGWE